MVELVSWHRKMGGLWPKADDTGPEFQQPVRHTAGTKAVAVAHWLGRRTSTHSRWWLCELQVAARRASA